MIKIDQLKLSIDSGEQDILNAIAKKLKLNSKSIIEYSILKKSVDARKKPDIYFVYSIIVKLSIDDEAKVLSKLKKDNNVNKYVPKNYVIPKPLKETASPIVVGAGPAGLFAAYIFALNHMNPIVFERGKQVKDRTKDILKFWETGVLDTYSNVQFGEGGAGTFSDGKLNTLVNDKLGRNKFVLETFVKFGAPSNILYDYKPHIGTDILEVVIENMRNEIISLGGTFNFNTKVEDFIVEAGKVTGVVANGKTYKSEVDFIAIKNGKKCFIQVTYMLSNNNTIEREFGAFKPISDCSPKYVMSLDKLDMSRNGIAHINIIDFLLYKKDITLT